MRRRTRPASRGTPGSRAFAACRQGEINPASLVKRQLDRVDDFLDPRAILEVALIALATLDDLVDEVAHEVGVKQRAPRFAGVTTWRVEALWDFDLVEFDRVRPGELDRLGHAVLLDQPADDGAALAVQACFDARVVANRDEARLDRSDGAVVEFAQKNVAVVDVHAHHPPGGA